MKLVVKFSLVFLLVFGSGFAVAAYLAYGFLQKNAVDEVMQNSQLMMQTAVSMRTYTTEPPGFARDLAFPTAATHRSNAAAVGEDEHAGAGAPVGGPLDVDDGHEDGVAIGIFAPGLQDGIELSHVSSSGAEPLIGTAGD